MKPFIDWCWREWALGLGFVWGTYCLQWWLKLGPLNVILFWKRTARSGD